MKEWMREIKCRMKNGVGPRPMKFNFPPTVDTVICDTKELGNGEKKTCGFLCNTLCFVTEHNKKTDERGDTE